MLNALQGTKKLPDSTLRRQDFTATRSGRPHRLDSRLLPCFLWCMAQHGAQLALAVLATACAALPQKVISAKSGLVYFVQGRVSVDGVGRLRTGARLRQLRTGEVLSTERGRAEVLMNPGAVLRLGDSSRLRMDDVSLTDGKVTIESGSAVLTLDENMPKEDRVVVEICGATVVLRREGMYRFDADARRLRVFSGRAELYDGSDDAPLLLKRGQSVEVQGWEVARFDTKNTDALERWAQARSYHYRRPSLPAIPPTLQPPPAQHRNSDDASAATLPSHHEAGQTK